MDGRTEWLTVGDVADRLGCSPAVVRELIRTRQLRALVKENDRRRTYRIRASDFESYRREHVRDSIEDDWE